MVAKPWARLDKAMSGSRESGLKAAETNKKKYGQDFYVNIGKKSSERYMAQPEEQRKPRGLAYLAIHDPERFKEISARGGRNRRKEA